MKDVTAALKSYGERFGERVELILIPEGGGVLFFCESGNDLAFDSIDEAKAFLASAPARRVEW